MKARRLGFTIVELLVVIVVIGILAGVVIVGYGTWRNDVVEKQLKSDLTGAASAMESNRNFGKDYPENLPANFNPSDGVTMSAKSGGGTYCIQASSADNPDVVFNIKNGRQPAPGTCDAYYTSVKAVAINTTCGIEYGKAYCWGDAGSAGSMLGNGSTGYSTTPVAVDTTVMKGKVTAIASGNGTVCAIADGKVYCWGNGTGGNLGNGSLSNLTTPVAVDRSIMNGTVTDIAMSGLTTCAIAGGKAYCWGTGAQGQLGNGITVATSTTPVKVSTLQMSGVVQKLTVGSAHFCALSEEKVYCWGSGAAVGNGSSSGSSVPVAVNTSAMSGKVTRIDSSNSHNCAIADSKAYCWGNGSYSQTASGHLGIGSTSTVNIPTAVVTSTMASPVTEIDTFGATTCAISDGRVYCWGENNTGRLGDGTNTTSNVPVAVNTSTMSKQVSAINVYTHVCAISDDALYCWGAGGGGQLGNGASVNSSVPVAVTTSVMKGKVTATSLGTQHTCAISDDRMYCWGNNAKGQLGVGGASPTNVPGLVTPNP